MGDDDPYPLARLTVELFQTDKDGKAFRVTITEEGKEPLQYNMKNRKDGEKILSEALAGAQLQASRIRRA
jgi:hypothetical protein